ncbi:hypothetical protein F5884DRAFT_254745 [Xylogone sp. PMI_703]|nr:hypothetical protein F5884DRAFT_254745 [Xylogone sp. PMI_703]
MRQSKVLFNGVPQVCSTTALGRNLVADLSYQQLTQWNPDNPIGIASLSNPLNLSYLAQASGIRLAPKIDLIRINNLLSIPTGSVSTTQRSLPWYNERDYLGDSLMDLTPSLSMSASLGQPINVACSMGGSDVEYYACLDPTYTEMQNQEQSLADVSDLVSKLKWFKNTQGATSSSQFGEPWNGSFDPNDKELFNFLWDFSPDFSTLIPSHPMAP